MVGDDGPETFLQPGPSLLGAPRCAGCRTCKPAACSNPEFEGDRPTSIRTSADALQSRCCLARLGHSGLLLLRTQILGGLLVSLREPWIVSNVNFHVRYSYLGRLGRTSEWLAEGKLIPLCTTRIRR